MGKVAFYRSIPPAHAPSILVNAAAVATRGRQMLHTRNMSPPNFICRWCIAAGWLSGFHAVVNGRGPVTGIRAVLQLPEPKRMQDVIEPI